MSQKLISSILKLFEYRRPMGGPTEQQFVEKFLYPVGFKRDQFQNLVLKVGDNPRILFSSHMDTVHREEGKQKLHLKDGILTQVSNSSCLGGDDTAGIWLMLEMIKAKIEGVYIIHYGEECGGIGSRAKASHEPDFFSNIDVAIAFDRCGYNDVITHQGGYRSASDAFAQSLAEQLGLGFKPNPHGIYTDTAEYTHLVAECTNISVGYENAHSPDEQQDIHFLLELRSALLMVDWSALAVQRDPNEEEMGNFWGTPVITSEDLEGLCERYPEVAAGIIAAMGLTTKDFTNVLREEWGYELAA